MVIVANECQIYNEGNYIAFIAWAFHITGYLIKSDVYTQYFSSHCTANIHIKRSITGIIYNTKYERQAQRMYAIAEASLAQWLSHKPCKPGIASSIPGFSSPLD